MPSRRRFLAGTATTGSVALAGCTGLPFVGGGSSVPLGDDFPKPADNPVQSGWPSFRRDSANTACVPDADPVEDPSVQWEAPRITQTGPRQAMWRTVTVQAATAYAGGDSVHAFDVASGDHVWQQSDVAPGRTAPEIRDGFAWMHAGEGESAVAGVDATTGEVAERRDLPGVPSRTPSLTADESYFVAPAEGTVVAALRNPSHATDYRPATWTNDVYGDSMFSPAATEHVTAVSYTGEVYTFSKWGSPGWRTDLDRMPASQPVVGEKRIYVGTQHGVVALERDSSARAWEFDGADHVTYAGVAFDGARVVVADESALHAVSAKTGESLWRYDFEHEVTAVPTVGGDRVYVGTRTEIHALTMDGSHAWTLELEDPAGASLALADGTLYTIVNRGRENDVAVVALA